jgi:hypothetical protein
MLPLAVLKARGSPLGTSSEFSRRSSTSARAVVYSPTPRWLRRTHRLPSRETRRQTLRRVRLCSDDLFSGGASTWSILARRSVHCRLLCMRPGPALLEYHSPAPNPRCDLNHVNPALKQGGSRRISPSCRSYCGARNQTRTLHSGYAAMDLLGLPLHSKEDRYRHSAQ